MKSRSFPLLLVCAAGVSPNLYAQQNSLDVLKKAASLNTQGRFRAALELVQPLLESKPEKPVDAVAGVAWDVRGLALQNLGKQDEARRCYEAAIKILRSLPAQKIQYANALENLASLEGENRQLKESRALRLRAIDVYGSAGDHAGVSRTASNLAVIEIALGSRKEARRYLADALREEAQVAPPDPLNQAWIFGAECLLDEAEGKYRDALGQINQVIDLWTREYGPSYYLLASAYSIRGRLHDLLGDDPRAEQDLRHSLSILSGNGEGNSSLYFFTEIMFARVLKNFGKRDDAMRMESSARSALEHLRHQECGGCTISVEGIR